MISRIWLIYGWYMANTHMGNIRDDMKQKWMTWYHETCRICNRESWRYDICLLVTSPSWSNITIQLFTEDRSPMYVQSRICIDAEINAARRLCIPWIFAKGPFPLRKQWWIHAPFWGRQKNGGAIWGRVMTHMGLANPPISLGVSLDLSHHF